MPTYYDYGSKIHKEHMKLLKQGGKMKDCNCANFEPLPNCSTKCGNYTPKAPKLPEVTVKEIGMKYYELGNSCSRTKEYFGIGNQPKTCGTTYCGTISCISGFVQAINEKRGYQ